MFIKRFNLSFVQIIWEEIKNLNLPIQLDQSFFIFFANNWTEPSIRANWNVYVYLYHIILGQKFLKINGNFL